MHSDGTVNHCTSTGDTLLLTKTLTKSSMNFFFILKSSGRVSHPAHLVAERWHIFCVFVHYCTPQGHRHVSGNLLLCANPLAHTAASLCHVI